GGCLLLWVIGKTGRRLLAKAVGRLLKRAAKAFVRYVRISLWAVRLEADRETDRWREMTAARKLVGLKRGRVKRTPMGVDVRVTLGGGLNLDTL
ncbi:hypothetical protein, partial [Streptomyces sp. DSM 41029]